MAATTSAPPAAYLGNDPYIFVSYAHKDKDRVLPFIAALQNKHNVWYDDGLHFGKEWPVEIASKLLSCAVFLFMTSDASLASDNCKGELNMARDNKKPFLNVLMDASVALPGWFQLQYSIYQDCRMYNYPTFDLLIDELEKKLPEIKTTISARALFKERFETQTDDAGRTIVTGVKDVTIGTVTIPLGVHEIADGAFEDCVDLTNLTIGGDVTAIGNRAFAGCTALTSVTIPETVKSIGRNVFDGCTALKEILFNAVDCTTDAVTYAGASPFAGCRPDVLKIGARVKTIPAYLFADCNAASVTIGKKVTSIGAHAFENCAVLSSLTIPAAVKTIEGTAFDDCGALTALTVEGEAVLPSFQDWRPDALTDLILGANVTKIADGTFQNCSGLKSVTLPEGLTALGQYAFLQCGELETVYYNAVDCKPVSSQPVVSSIPADFDPAEDWSPFGLCPHLHTVIFGARVHRIPDFLFFGCTALCSVTFGKKVGVIGSHAFARCRDLSSVTLPETIKMIDRGAFAGTGISEITIPEGLKEIGDGVFLGWRDDDDEECTPDALLCVHWNAISCAAASGFILGLFGDNLKTVVFGKKVKSLPNGLFLKCRGLISVTLPDALTVIGAWTFGRCDALKTVVFPKGLTGIGDCAFSECIALETVTIPEGLCEIGQNAFENCAALHTVYWNAEYCNTFRLFDPQSNTVYAVFYGCDALTTIRIGDSVRIVPDYLFAFCDKLTDLTFGKNLLDVGCEAFKDCAALKTLVLPETLETIRDRAFLGCDDLAALTVPSRVTSIGDGAFDGCDRLSTLTVDSEAVVKTYPSWCPPDVKILILGNGVTKIDDNVFRGCATLESVSFPETLKQIGQNAFHGCSALTTIFWNAENCGTDRLYDAQKQTIYAVFSQCRSIRNLFFGVNVLRVPDFLFAFCDTLTCVKIGENTTAIGQKAFYKCSSVASLELPASLSSIENSAFYKCKALTAVEYKGTAAQWQSVQIDSGNDPLQNASVVFI